MIVEIAVIEDDPADIRLISESLAKIGIRCELTVAQDGEEGVDCLLRRNKFQGSSKPDLILLDMHLPKLTGLEILKSVPDSANMPICLVTSSERERPLVEAHFGRPVSYLSKPVTPDKIRACLRSYDHLRPLAA
jgi:CheY-like chemotaxis protein